MATELAKAYVQIIPSARGIKGSIQNIIDPEAGKAGKSGGTKLGGALLTGTKAVIKTGAVALGATLVAGINEGAKLEQSIGGIETLFKDSSDTVIKNAQKAYRTAGVSANKYMEQATSFSATLLQGLGGDTAAAAEYADMAIIAMGDNANKMGTNIQDIQNAYQGFAKDNYTMLDNLKLGYGGTAGEMARLINDHGELDDSIEVTAETVKDVPFHEMIKAIQNAQDELGITGTTALEAAETVSGSFGSMAAAAQNFLGSLALGENVKESAIALAETFATFLFDNLIPMLGTIIQSLPTAIGAFVETAIPLIKEQLTSLFEGFNMDFLLQGGELIVNFIVGILEKAPEAIMSIGNMLNDMRDNILSNLPEFLEKGIELIANLIAGIVQHTPQIIMAIASVMANVVITIAKHLPDLLRKGVEIIKNMITGIVQQIPNIVSSMGKVLSNLITKIRDNLPKFLQKGWELIVEFAKGIVQKIPYVVGKIPQVINSIINKFKNMIGRFKNIGADIVRGLWNGISSVENWILGKISGFVDSIVGGIKGFFGISSPSRVMKDEVGKYLPIGLADGIEDNLNPVSRAMNSLENEVMRDLDNSYSLSANSNLVSGMASSSGGGVPNIYIDTMHVRNDDDIDRIARELSVLIKRQNRGLSNA